MWEWTCRGRAPATIQQADRLPVHQWAAAPVAGCQTAACSGCDNSRAVEAGRQQLEPIYRRAPNHVSWLDVFDVCMLPVLLELACRTEGRWQEQVCRLPAKPTIRGDLAGSTLATACRPETAPGLAVAQPHAQAQARAPAIHQQKLCCNSRLSHAPTSLSFGRPLLSTSGVGGSGIMSCLKGSTRVGTEGNRAAGEPYSLPARSSRINAAT